MSGRKFSAVNGYRYGFNGKELDKSTGNDNYDFNARIYDGRLGRWLSTDPLQERYANLTPYNGMGNNPLLFVDPDGKTIIIHSKRKRDLLKTLDHIAMIQMTKEGSSTLKKIHESNDNYFIKGNRGAEARYVPSTNTLNFDPNATISESEGYLKHPLFTLGHELEHADEDYRGNYYSKGRSEGKGVNTENYYRSVLGGRKAFRRKYNWGLWDRKLTNNPQDFNDQLSPNPNGLGERASFTRREIRGEIKLDSKSTYTTEKVGTFDADSQEVKEEKNGIIYFFDYKKDKDSKVEKKAVIIRITYANEEKK